MIRFFSRFTWRDNDVTRDFNSSDLLDDVNVKMTSVRKWFWPLSSDWIFSFIYLFSMQLACKVYLQIPWKTMHENSIITITIKFYITRLGVQAKTLHHYSFGPINPICCIPDAWNRPPPTSTARCLLAVCFIPKYLSSFGLYIRHSSRSEPLRFPSTLSKPYSIFTGAWDCFLIKENSFRNFHSTLKIKINHFSTLISSQ